MEVIDVCALRARWNSLGFSWIKKIGCLYEILIGYCQLLFNIRFVLLLHFMSIRVHIRFNSLSNYWTWNFEYILFIKSIYMVAYYWLIVPNILQIIPVCHFNYLPNLLRSSFHLPNLLQKFLVIWFEHRLPGRCVENLFIFLASYARLRRTAASTTVLCENDYTASAI